jgi:beta-glucanase (GH16 family)
LNRTLGLILAGSLFAMPSTGCAAAPEGVTKLDSPEWEMTFSDEFDGEAVDTAKWDVLTRKNNHNNEKQYYLPQQASIVDGVLRITATDEPYDGKDYRSARLESTFAQAYGKFEVRAKIPTTKGIWPAIWLLPRDVRWPRGGEIDIMEHHGSNPLGVSCAIHFADAEGKHKFVHGDYDATDAEGRPVRWPDDFHVYSTVWTPNDIAVFVDDVEYFRAGRDRVPAIDTPMSVILNTAVGGRFDGDPDGTTVFPQTFDVDYVRVYQKRGGYETPGP